MFNFLIDGKDLDGLPEGGGVHPGIVGVLQVGNLPLQHLQLVQPVRDEDAAGAEARGAGSSGLSLHILTLTGGVANTCSTRRMEALSSAMMMLDVIDILTHQVVVRGADCVLEGDDVEDGEEFPFPVLTAGQTEGAEKEKSYRTDLGHVWSFVSTETSREIHSF